MKKFVAGFLSGALMFGIIGAGASGIWDNIEVLRNDIKVVVNGNEITSDNFLYNDTTYLPMRAIGDALGEKVEYDEVTNTAYIGERNNDMQTQNVTGKYNPTGEDAEYCIIHNGKYYIKIDGLSEKHNLKGGGENSSGWDDATQSIIFYVDGKEIGRWVVDFRDDNDYGYIPYDTYVDEIEPLLK